MRPNRMIYPIALLVIALAGCGQDRGAEEITNETTEATVEAEITSSAALQEATNGYEGYVADHAGLLEKRTEGLVDAVLARVTWRGRRSCTRPRGSRGSGSSRWRSLAGEPG